MCLDRVTYVNTNPTDTDWKTGFKVGVKGDGYFGTSLYCFVQLDTIAISEQANLRAADKRVYPSGFHILVTLEDAQSYLGSLIKSVQIHKVRYRGVLAKGTLYKDTELCVVAKEMFIPSEWKDDSDVQEPLCKLRPQVDKY